MKMVNSIEQLAGPTNDVGHRRQFRPVGKKFLKVAAFNGLHDEILLVGVRKIIAHGQKGFVPDLGPSLSSVSKSEFDGFKLSRRGISDLAGALAEDNLGIIDSIVSFVKAAAFDLAVMIDDLVTSLMKDLVRCEHKGGWLNEAGEVMSPILIIYYFVKNGSDLLYLVKPSRPADPVCMESTFQRQDWNCLK